MSAAAENDGIGVTRYRSHALISQRLGALEAACRYALVGRTEAPWPGNPQNSLNRETLRVAVEEARELIALAAPKLLRQVVLAQPGDGERDAAADQKQAVTVLATEEDPSELRGVRAGVGHQGVHVVRDADLDDPSAVVDVHLLHRHENSPAVGAPGAGIAGSLDTTVGAPAGTRPSPAGRAAGGWLRGLLTRASPRSRTP